MCDVASRLVKGAAANVCNLVDWSANVKMAKSSKDLVNIYLLQGIMGTEEFYKKIYVEKLVDRCFY